MEYFYVDKFNERKWLYTWKGNKQTIPRTNYYERGLHWWERERELLTDTPTKAESQLHSLEWAVDDVGLSVNAEKSEYMHFNWRGDISTSNGGSLKLDDKFT